MLCEWFADMPEFETYNFCTMYPFGQSASPLKKPVVVFGTKSIDILEKSVNEAGAVITDRRYAELTFSIGVHLPKSAGSILSYEVIYKIIDLLLFDTDLNIVKINTSEMEYIRNTDSLYMECEIIVKDELLKGDTYPDKLPLE